RLVVRGHVPHDQPAVAVDGQVHHVERAGPAARYQEDEPAGEDGGEGGPAGPDEPGPRGAGPALRVISTFALGCGTGRIHTRKRYRVTDPRSARITTASSIMPSRRVHSR